MRPRTTSQSPALSFSSLRLQIALMALKDSISAYLDPLTSDDLLLYDHPPEPENYDVITTYITRESATEYIERGDSYVKNITSIDSAVKNLALLDTASDYYQLAKIIYDQLIEVDNEVNETKRSLLYRIDMTRDMHDRLSEPDTHTDRGDALSALANEYAATIPFITDADIEVSKILREHEKQKRKQNQPSRMQMSALTSSTANLIAGFELRATQQQAKDLLDKLVNFDRDREQPKTNDTDLDVSTRSTPKRDRDGLPKVENIDRMETEPTQYNNDNDNFDYENAPLFEYTF